MTTEKLERHHQVTAKVTLELEPMSHEVSTIEDQNESEWA